MSALASEIKAGSILIIDDDQSVTHSFARILTLQGYKVRANTRQHETPVAVVTGDYFLDDRISAELQNLGASLKFKPLWLEDLVDLARTLLLHKVTH